VSLTLPISSYEFDPSQNLVDSVCMLMGGQLRELNIYIYGNGWIPNERMQRSRDGSDFKTVPLVIRADARGTGGSSGPLILPYPRLQNLDRLTGLERLSIRRDTRGLTGMDPLLPLLPLIHSLSLRTSPALTDLSIDGFSLEREEVWACIAGNLGTAGDVLMDDSAHATSRSSAASSDPTPRPAGTTGEYPVCQPVVGLRSLRVHNFYGPCTHLSYLRFLVHLRHLSLGNYNINMQISVSAATAESAYNSFSSMMHELQTQGLRLGAAASVAPPSPSAAAAAAAAAELSAHHPLTAATLSSLAELLPQLVSLELIGQGQLTNTGLKHWAGINKPKSAKQQPQPQEPEEADVAALTEEAKEGGLSALVDVAESSSTAASTASNRAPAAKSPATGRRGRHRSTASLSASSLKHSGPFPLLTSLTLIGCRPLGYSSLATLAGGRKLKRLVWHGVEAERRLMLPVQVAAQKAAVDAQFFFHKGIRSE
jgi:hypothetical protein